MRYINIDASSLLPISSLLEESSPRVPRAPTRRGRLFRTAQSCDGLSRRPVIAPIGATQGRPLHRWPTFFGQGIRTGRPRLAAAARPGPPRRPVDHVLFCFCWPRLPRASTPGGRSRPAPTRRSMSLAGPDRVSGPSPDARLICRSRTAGIAPGDCEGAGGHGGRQGRLFARRPSKRLLQRQGSYFPATLITRPRRSR